MIIISHNIEIKMFKFSKQI